MIDRIRRVLTRHESDGSRAPKPDVDWRVTLRRRNVVAAAAFGLWAVGIEARLVNLQISHHADLVARATVLWKLGPVPAKDAASDRQRATP